MITFLVKACNIDRRFLCGKSIPIEFGSNSTSPIIHRNEDSPMSPHSFDMLLLQRINKNATAKKKVK